MSSFALPTRVLLKIATKHLHLTRSNIITTEIANNISSEEVAHKMFEYVFNKDILEYFALRGVSLGDCPKEFIRNKIIDSLLLALQDKEILSVYRTDSTAGIGDLLDEGHLYTYVNSMLENIENDIYMSDIISNLLTARGLSTRRMLRGKIDYRVITGMFSTVAATTILIDDARIILWERGISKDNLEVKAMEYDLNIMPILCS